MERNNKIYDKIYYNDIIKYFIYYIFAYLNSRLFSIGFIKYFILGEMININAYFSVILCMEILR